MRAWRVVLISIGCCLALACGSESSSGDSADSGAEGSGSGGQSAAADTTTSAVGSDATTQGASSSTGVSTTGASDSTVTGAATPTRGTANTTTSGGAGGSAPTAGIPDSALRVPGGALAMGRSASGSDACPADAECHPSEEPEHEVDVAAFWLDATEVTVGEFRNWVHTYEASLPSTGAGSHASVPGSGWQADYAANLPSERDELRAALACDDAATYAESGGSVDRLPVNCVSWYEAQAFCIGRGGRLPTEAEWEFAAAGGDENRLYAWGEEPASEARAAVAVDTVVEAGSLSAGAGRYGHHDLSGNVWEWALDWLDPEKYQRALECPDCLPSSQGSHRVLRGGAWSYPATAARAAARSGELPEERSRAVGFRCAYDE